MLLLHNFRLVEEKNFGLNYLNRGFQYNDGFFDTLIYREGRLRYLHDHLHRMRRALAVFEMQVPAAWLEEAFWNHQVGLLIQQNDLTASVLRVKVNCWRKTGGLFTPDSAEAEVLVSLAVQPALPPVIATAGFAGSLPNRFTPFSFVKGPYALHYVQAGLTKKRLQVEEVILMDEKGYISECLVSNIFWIRGQQIFTPALETGCIDGIMRLNVLRACQMLRLDPVEGLFSKEQLLQAEFIFTSNVTGLRPIQQLGGQSFAVKHPAFMQIEQLVLAY